MNTLQQNTHTSFNAHMHREKLTCTNPSFYTHVWREIEKYTNLLVKLALHVQKFLPFLIAWSLGCWTLRWLLVHHTPCQHSAAPPQLLRPLEIQRQDGNEKARCGAPWAAADCLSLSCGNLAALLPPFPQTSLTRQSAETDPTAPSQHPAARAPTQPCF